jgi:hypothetical protein
MAEQILLVNANSGRKFGYVDLLTPSQVSNSLIRVIEICTPFHFHNAA